ncbi:BnaC04g51230D [Brassica napus]|uniref:BnaC04g51230D protein n=1 Tax=Brassica napus TaxID=3708 RepID=A0A078GQM3_BRANA|nr:BnaC04g51230D [Brassica napus]
MVHRFLQSSVF